MIYQDLKYEVTITVLGKIRKTEHTNGIKDYENQNIVAVNNGK